MSSFVRILLIVLCSEWQAFGTGKIVTRTVRQTSSSFDSGTPRGSLIGNIPGLPQQPIDTRKNPFIGDLNFGFNSRDNFAFEGPHGEHSVYEPKDQFDFDTKIWPLVPQGMDKGRLKERYMSYMNAYDPKSGDLPPTPERFLGINPFELGFSHRGSSGRTRLVNNHNVHDLTDPTGQRSVFDMKQNIVTGGDTWNHQHSLTGIGADPLGFVDPKAFGSFMEKHVAYHSNQGNYNANGVKTVNPNLIRPSAAVEPAAVALAPSSSNPFFNF